MQSKPTDYSYRVTDHFYGGEYPFSRKAEEGIPKLNRIVAFGIKHFIDLTSEPLTKYAEHLPKHCTRIHLPTPDYTIPVFARLKDIHSKIDDAERSNEIIYIHCRGGHDRTGAVVATYFVWKGMTLSDAKQKFYEVFVPPVRGRYPHRPLIETDWNALERYKDWLGSGEHYR